MPDTVRVKPPCRREDALAVLRRLRQAGHEAYFAGGCVRDELLGLKPNDYDVATDALPQRVRELFPNTQAVGAAFGVILVRQGRSVVEVATFRTEGKYEDGRRPAQVHFATAREDAQRRDFTINGLFLDPVENRVIDYVGGQEDLAARRLRAIGDPAARFAEDHLRLLRAVRFAARFGLAIEPATAAAMRACARSLTRISPERIADELRLMLTPPSRAAAWPMLWGYGLAPVIFRFMPGDRPAVLDESRSVLVRLSPRQPVSFPLALSAGVVDWRWQGDLHEDIRAWLAVPAVWGMARAMRQALRLSNDESDAMASILTSVGSLLADPPPRVASMKRFLARATAADACTLLDALAAVGIRSDRVRWLKEQFASLRCTPLAPQPLVSGDDLVAAGLVPGPAFRQILNELYDAQLEDRIATKQQALEMALAMARTSLPRPSAPRTDRQNPPPGRDESKEDAGPGSGNRSGGR